MENIFEGRKKYADGYSLVGTRNFNEGEKAQVKSAKVVVSQFGLSVCFYIHGGGQFYVPLSRDSEGVPGDTVDLNRAKILTLVKDDNEIQRIEI